MRLPKVPYAIKQQQSEIMQLRGIDFSDNYKDGALAECKNLSTRRFPTFCTRRAREKQDKYSAVTAITAWNKLVVVQNGRLFYDGEDVGEITDGDKQFAVINTKLVIFPDKVYFDIDEKEIKPLGAKHTGKGATFATNKITVSWDVDFKKLFKDGDCITVSGCTANEANNKDIVIKTVEEKVLNFEDDTLTAATETAELTFERKIPDMDYICESENRLWGCSNKERSIFASALGDPTNFYIYSGLSTDSYALAIGSEGDFTGCCKLSSSVLFWKNNMLHKILGSYPAEYALYDYEIEGVLTGCHKSLQVINETLFYMSAHGVYAYSGGSTVFVSDVFGERQFVDAVGGNNGNAYYLSAREGDKWHLFTYDIKNGIWMQEDNTHIIDFARIGKDVYFLTNDGDVYLADSGKEDNTVEWLARFTPFYETIEGRKRYSKIILRLQLPKGSWLKVETRCDGGRWIEIKKILGDTYDAKVLPVAVNRCDKFEIRLTGKGQFAMLGVMRQFSIGGTA